MDLKNAKEREWYVKMSGFYGTDKMKDLERKDIEEQLLKEKLYKQTYGE
jgi:hypothetical protein